MDGQGFRITDWLRRAGGVLVIPVHGPATARIDVALDRDGGAVSMRSPDASAGFYWLRIVRGASRAPVRPT